MKKVVVVGGAISETADQDGMSSKIDSIIGKNKFKLGMLACKAVCDLAYKLRMRLACYRVVMEASNVIARNLQVD